MDHRRPTPENGIVEIHRLDVCRRINIGEVWNAEILLVGGLWIKWKTVLGIVSWLPISGGLIAAAEAMCLTQRNPAPCSHSASPPSPWQHPDADPCLVQDLLDMAPSVGRRPSHPTTG